RYRIVLSRYTGGSDNLRPVDVARRLNRDIDAVVPFHRKIAVAANLGVPYVLRERRWWGPGRVLDQLARDVEAVVPHGARGRSEGDDATTREPERRERDDA